MTGKPGGEGLLAASSPIQLHLSEHSCPSRGCDGPFKEGTLESVHLADAHRTVAGPFFSIHPATDSHCALHQYRTESSEVKFRSPNLGQQFLIWTADSLKARLQPPSGGAPVGVQALACRRSAIFICSSAPSAKDFAPSAFHPEFSPRNTQSFSQRPQRGREDVRKRLQRGLQSAGAWVGEDGLESASVPLSCGPSGLGNIF